MEKFFAKWLHIKESLDQKNEDVPFVSEGDVWWISIGENIGSEISGKNRRFSRPVIIFKKLAPHFYFVIPLTTKLKSGPWYTSFFHRGKIVAACLHQARTIDYRRLLSKLGTLNRNSLNLVKNKFKTLYNL